MMKARVYAFEGGTLVKVNGDRPEYFDGYKLMQELRIAAAFAAGAKDGENLTVALPRPEPVIQCPCTTFEQDDTCPVGFPSALCGACNGLGIITPEKLADLGREMMQIADSLGALESLFSLRDHFLPVIPARSGAPGVNDPMVMHKNTVRHDPDNGLFGDCHRACIATILGLRMEDVPHFYHDPANVDGGKLIADFLRTRGLSETTFHFPGSYLLEEIMELIRQTMPDTPVILGGTSRTGCNHSVVVLGGEIVNDPAGTGIVGPLNNGFYGVSTLSVLPNFVAYASEELIAMEGRARYQFRVARENAMDASMWRFHVHDGGLQGQTALLKAWNQRITATKALTRVERELSELKALHRKHTPAPVAPLSGQLMCRSVVIPVGGKPPKDVVADLAAEDERQRRENGLNNEGDPIGGDSGIEIPPNPFNLAFFSSIAIVANLRNQHGPGPVFDALTKAMEAINDKRRDHLRQNGEL